MTERPFLKGLDDLEQGAPYCAGCGIQIIEGNDSGWHGFVKGRDGKIKTQPLCLICFDAMDTGGPKTDGEDT